MAGCLSSSCTASWSPFDCPADTFTPYSAAEEASRFFLSVTRQRFSAAWALVPLDEAVERTQTPRNLGARRNLRGAFKRRGGRARSCLGARGEVSERKTCRARLRPLDRHSRTPPPLAVRDRQYMTLRQGTCGAVGCLQILRWPLPRRHCPSLPRTAHPASHRLARPYPAYRPSQAQSVSTLRECGGETESSTSPCSLRTFSSTTAACLRAS